MGYGEYLAIVSARAGAMSAAKKKSVESLTILVDILAV